MKTPKKDNVKNYRGHDCVKSSKIKHETITINISTTIQFRRLYNIMKIIWHRRFNSQKWSTLEKVITFLVIYSSIFFKMCLKSMIKLIYFSLSAAATTITKRVMTSLANKQASNCLKFILARFL